MFYTPEEACEFLGIDAQKLNRWINRLQMETRTLPNTKGTFISRKDVLLIEASIKQPDILT